MNRLEAELFDATAGLFCRLKRIAQVYRSDSDNPLAGRGTKVMQPVIIRPAIGRRGVSVEFRHRGHIQTGRRIQDHIINACSLQGQVVVLGRKTLAGKARIGIVMLRQDDAGTGITKSRPALPDGIAPKGHDVFFVVGRRNGDGNAKTERVALIVNPRARHVRAKLGFQVFFKQVRRLQNMGVTINEAMALAHCSPPFPNNALRQLQPHPSVPESRIKLRPSFQEAL